MDAPFGGTRSERVTMAWALAMLFGTGGLLVLVTLVLPNEDSTQTAGVAFVGLAAIATSAALAALAGKLDAWTLAGVLGLGSVLVSLTVLFGGANATAYPLYYLWVAIYAAYFFAPRLALAEGIFAVLAYVVVLRADGDVPVPEVHWLMAAGTMLIAGVMISRLTAAVRDQAADLANVAAMASRLGSVGEMATQTCDGLRGSAGADVVALFTALPGEAGLEVTAMAGTAEAGLLLSTDAARMALQQGFERNEPVVIQASDGQRSVLRGTVAGHVQPVLRDGQPVGLLAMAWTTPRRQLGERVESASLLYAGEAGVVLERAEQLTREKERRALEINDNIVQGLVVARMAARGGHVDTAVEAIDGALDAARRLITEQLEDISGGDLVSGLMRQSSASL